MAKAIHTRVYKLLLLKNDLREYFYNKVSTIELRFPAVTSLDGEKAAIMIFPGKFNTAEAYSTLLIPYNTEASYSSNTGDDDNVQTVVKGYKKQKITQLVQLGALKEVGFTTHNIRSLGEPISSYNSRENATTPHFKIPVLVKDYFYKPGDRYSKSPKRGEPVYVANDLLENIFTVDHPQRQVYELYKSWLKGEIKDRSFIF